VTHKAPPPTVERLLDDPIGSTGTLELLLAVRAGAGKPQSVHDLSTAIGSPRSWTEHQLDVLARERLVVAVDGGWAYAPATPRLASAVDELARLWQRDRRSVIRWLLEPRSRKGRTRRRH
jgi:hypothetical protein